MSVFVDTSAWFALASATDDEHRAARAIYAELVERDEPLVTTSYVLAETMALIQHRLGWRPLELFVAATHAVEIVWVDEVLHREAEALLLARRRRAVNVVDATSFVVMRSRALEVAFAFDDDFAREGFRLLRPSGT